MTETKVSTVKTKELVSKPTQEIKPGMNLKSLLATDTVRRRFEQVLGKKSAGFISSILSATNINPSLESCDPMSIISSAMIAASLDLPINSSLGFAHLVPYSNKCQFQMGWRGFVQLCQRTGQYKTLNVTEVYDGEVKKADRFSGLMEFDETGKKSDKVVGYVAYMQMLNGFEKWLYMTKENVEAHGKRYSKSYGTGQWTKDFDAMARKTVIKMLLNRWGMMSIDIQKAIDFDQAVVGQNDKPEYIDVPEGETTAIETESATAKLTEEWDRNLKVEGVALTDLEGKEAWVVRFVGQKGKVYTSDKSIADFCKKAEKEGMSVDRATETKEGHTWLIEIVSTKPVDAEVK